MGSYKIGSECCNNCVHWDCHSERKFIGNPPTEIYTSSNSDKCFLTGRNTLSKDTCGMFKHIGDITRTFAAEDKHDKGDYVKNMLDGLDESSRIYCGAMVDQIRMSQAESASEAAAARRAREEENERIREYNRAIEAKREEILARNYKILVENGMDPNASSSDQDTFESLYRKAVDGDAEARYELGMACFYGRDGARKDEKRGYAHFNKSGTVAATYMMGLANYLGKGVEENNNRAFILFEKAANKGFAKAQYRLGECYHKGYGIGKDFGKALELYEKASKNGSSDAEEAIPKCIAAMESAAEGGNAKAMNQLGILYYNGKHVDEDYEEARKWFEAAAKAGSASGMNNFAEMLRDGEGGDEDIGMAVRWFLKASREGNELARKNVKEISQDKISELFDNNGNLVGFIFENFKDDGYKESTRAQFKELVDLAKQGNGMAFAKLAAAFNGTGVGGCVKDEAVAYLLNAKSNDFGDDPAVIYEKGMSCYWGKDEKKALDLLLRAAEKGYGKAEHRIGMLLWEGNILEKDRTKAWNWWNRSVEHGYTDQCAFYGNMCYGKDRERALYYYRKCAETGGLDDVMYNVGRDFYYGRGKTIVRECEWQDYEVARILFEGASRRGHHKADVFLGYCYRNGYGVEKNEQMAFNLFLKSAEAGESLGQCWVGRSYFNGWGTGKDAVKAFSWFMKAAEQGDPDGEYYVGGCYKTGQGVGQDMAKAVEWLAKAADHNSAEAQYVLGDLYKRGGALRKMRRRLSGCTRNRLIQIVR